MMTDSDRRDKARLRSERWRRAHGIGRDGPQNSRGWPQASAAWYRRRKRARDAASVAYASATVERAEVFAAALTRDLARCAALERESLAILAELTAYADGAITPSVVRRQV